MKKLLFSVAILAVAASCSKSEVVDMPQTSQIGFTTLNDRVISKAANDGDDAFRVFAQKGDASAWFIEDYVDYSDSATAIAPVGGPYYWPTDGSSMKFYAYAPYTTSGCNVAEGTPATDAITLTYTVPADAQEDFTVAAPITYTDEDAYPASGAVEFTFSHMLSKVTVYVRLKGEGEGAEGTDTDFAANYYVSDDDSTVTGALDAPFTATFVPKTYDMVVADGIAGKYTSSAASTSLSSASYDEYTSYYIAPQPFAGCTLQINGLTVRDAITHSPIFNGDMSILTLTGKELNADGVDTTTSAFEAGKHYVFTVTVSGSSTEEDGDPLVEITFKAENVEWTEAGDYTVGLDQE